MAQETEIQTLVHSFQSRPPDAQSAAQVERLLRTAIFQPACELIGLLFQQAMDQIDAAYQPKPGERRKGRQKLQLSCLFGSFAVQRDSYHHPGKHSGHFPADAALGLEGAYTPALARLVCLEGADESSYRKASNHLREVGGIHIAERQIQRLANKVGADAAAWQRRQSPPGACDAPVLSISADATGVPMRKEELAGRKGKGPEGQATTRMANLGCVFTQHTLDEEGNPLRDHDSTTYLSGFMSQSDFGIGLRREALRRGLACAGRTVLLIDGASGLEKLGRDSFPEATQIVDFYHALEHLYGIIALLMPDASPQALARRRRHWKKLLARDGVSRIIAAARRQAAATGRLQQVEPALAYLENNLARMQYGTFRKQGLFIGSGVIEAGCKSIIAQRCKQSGMFWSLPGAEATLALRCVHASGYTDAFWKGRHNQHAAHNDSLALAA